MLNSEQVRLTILYGDIPAYWHIIRGSAPSAIRAGWIRLLSSFFYLFLVPTVAVWIQFFFHSLHFDFSFVLLYIAILPLGGIVGSCVSASRARRSVLAFLPEGCLQFNEINSDLPVTQQVFWYASIAEMQLNSNFWTGTYLTIRDHTGKIQEWYPDPAHGRCDHLIQSMLTGYTTYHILHSPRSDRSHPA